MPEIHVNGETFTVDAPVGTSIVDHLRLADSKLTVDLFSEEVAYILFLCFQLVVICLNFRVHSSAPFNLHHVIQHA